MRGNSRTRLRIESYLKQGMYVFSTFPQELYLLSEIIKGINDGDINSIIVLKALCNEIDKNVFTPLINWLKPEFDISTINDFADMDGKTSITKLQVDQLKTLVEINMQKALGLTLDKRENIKFNHNRASDYFNEILSIGQKSGLIKELYIYNNQKGIYEPFSDELFGTIFRYITNIALEDSWKKKFEENTFEAIKREEYKEINNVLIEGLIAVDNGILNINTLQLEPYSEKYAITSKISTPYSAESRAMLFEKAIQEIFDDDDERIAVIQEIFGYCLLSNCKASKFFLAHGIGNNAKSTVLECLQYMVGEDNVSSLSLSDFSKDFALEAMIDRKLNISNESEGRGAVNTELIKAITTGESITVNRKNRVMIKYKPNIKLLFASNSLPSTYDISDGFWRRILIIPFTRQFSESEVDKGLKEKLFKETSGILNWSIIGAQRLIKNNYQFTKSKEIERITHEYKRQQNAVEIFLDEVLVEKTGTRIKKVNVFEAFQNWVKEESLDSIKFSTDVKFWNAAELYCKSRKKSYTLKISNGVRYLENYEISELYNTRSFKNLKR